MQHTAPGTFGHMKCGYGLLSDQHLVQDASCLSEHLFAGLAERYLLSLFHEQLQSQVDLKLLHLHGDSGLAEAQLISGSRVIQVTCHGLKDAQLTQGQIF